MEIRYLFALQWNWIFEEAINIGLICGIVNCVDGKYVWQIKDWNWIVRHSTDSSAITGKRQAAKSTKDDLLRDCLLSSTMHLPNSQFSSIPFGALHISCCCSSDKYPNTRDKKKRSKMKDQITICCHSIMGQTSNKSLSDGSANPNPDTNFEPWTRGTKTKKKKRRIQIVSAFFYGLQVFGNLIKGLSRRSGLVHLSWGSVDIGWPGSWALTRPQ